MNLTSITQETLEKHYNENTPATIELKALVDEITSMRQIRFTNDHAQKQFPELMASGQLGKDGIVAAGKDIGVKPTSIFVYALYKYFAPLFGYTLSGDLSTMLAFVDKVTDDLQANGGMFGLKRLAEGLTEMLLQGAVTGYGAPIYEFAVQLDLKVFEQGNENFWHILLANWSRWQFTTGQTWTICRHWSLDMAPATNGSRNSDLGLIGKFIRNYAKNAAAEAPRLKELAIADLETPLLDELVVATFIGLSEGGHLSFDEWLPWLDRPETSQRALIIAGNITTPPADKPKLLAKVTGTAFSAQASYFLPSFYENILHSTPADQTGITGICESQLQSLLKSEDPVLVQRTILAIARLNDDPAKWTSLFVELIQTGKYSDALTPVINGFFSQRKSVGDFQSFLAAYAVSKGTGPEYQVFMPAIHVLAEEDRAGLEKVLLEMMIDDRGAVRWAGHQLFYEVLFGSQLPVLSFDILTLESLSQYKLATYLLHPFRDVDRTIPPVHALLASPEEAVRKVTLFKLHDLVYHFRDKVVEQVDKSLPAGFPGRSAILTELQAAVDELRRESKFKVEIRELDPHLNQSRLFRSYTNIYQKRIREQLMREQRRPDRLFGQVQKISVPRGGGWKPTSAGEVQQLNTVRVSWSLSRIFTIIPEKMEPEFQRIFVNDNSENAFDGWQTIGC